MTVSVPEASASTVNVVLKKEALVPIRFEDTSRALLLNLGKTPGAHLLIGVGGSDRPFRPATLVSDDSGGRTYQNLIAFDLPVKLVLSSSFFQLANERGTRLRNQTTAVSLTVPSGQTLTPLRVVVTGARNP